MAEEDGLDIGTEGGKPGSKKKLIIIGVLLLVLLGSAGEVIATPLKLHWLTSHPFIWR